MRITQFIPSPIKERIKDSRLYLKHRSEAVNIYHCCVHKTASQWVKGLLADSRTFRYSGLRIYTYQNEQMDGYDPRPITERSFKEPFPESTIVSPLYIDYPNFRTIPKPESYRAFFVTRDPRDILVSSYFSMKYSHSLIGDMRRHRDRLKEMPKEEGLYYVLERMENMGLFRALQSWVGRTDNNRNIMTVSFEDMTGPDQHQVLYRLFQHCTLGMPYSLLGELLHDHSFRKITGRAKGEEDIKQHYRKGIAGDWKAHFDGDLEKEFKRVTGNLLVDLGYEDNPSKHPIIRS